MASTSSVSQANAELACNPSRSGENLPAHKLSFDGLLKPSLNIYLGTVCVGWGWRPGSDQGRSGAGPHESPTSVKADLSSVTS